MERPLYVNFSENPISLDRLTDHITDIAGAAQGVVDIIEEVAQAIDTDEWLRSRFALIKSAVAYIAMLAGEKLLPNTDGDGCAPDKEVK